MRRLAALVLLCLLAGACGDDAVFEPTTTLAAATTTTIEATTTSDAATTSTTVPGTTTSTAPETTTTWATFGVPAENLCVIDHLSDDALNVRSGPGAAFGVIGTLPFDATGVHATGLAAYDGEGRTWRQIEFTGGPGWVAGWLVTAHACSLEAAAQYGISEPNCDLRRLEVRSGPGPGYARRGTASFAGPYLEGTGASSTGTDGALWRQIRFRGEVGWVPAANVIAPPVAVMCPPESLPPSAGCVEGVEVDCLQAHPLWQALESIGVGGPWSEIDPDAFVIEGVRHFAGPEDANVVAPRPTVERWYVVGYAETDPGFRGRWLFRRTTAGFGLAAVAPYGSTGFGEGIWETCVDTCQTGRPLAGEWCDPACVEDYIFRSCEGIAPGTWAPGDCAGPPPEVLGCVEP